MALGDQQVTLVEHAGEHRPLVGQRPAGRPGGAGSRGARAPRGLGRTRGSSERLWPSTRASISASSRCSRSACAAARIRWRRSGSNSTGCTSVARPVSPSPPSDVAQRRAGQPLGDLTAVLAILRLERARQPHLAERLDRPDHVVGGDEQRLGVLGDHGQAHAGLARRARHHHRRPAVAAAIDLDDIAGAQPGQRRLAFGPAGDRSFGSVLGAVLPDVAVGALRLGPRLGDAGAQPFGAGLQADDVAVGLVLGEREVEEVVGLLAGVRPHEVGSHVVGRAKRRAQVERATAGQRGDPIERDERAPQHDGLTDVVDAAPPGPTR